MAKTKLVEVKGNPEQVAHANKVRPSYIGHIEQYVDMANEKNHPKKELFAQVLTYVSSIEDASWWWGQWSTQELMNKAAKEILGK